MTTNEIKEVLFKECAEAFKTLEEEKTKENRIKAITLFSLVADTLDLEYEYYNYKDKNGYEKYDQSVKSQILKNLENNNLEEEEEI